MTTIFGISNCDTVKKALKWLDKNNISYTFHDFRKDGIDADLISQFFQRGNWQDLVNKRSTTYRNLEDNVKSELNEQLASEIFLEQPTLIKRPVLIHNNQLTLGFKESTYQQVFVNE